jgi:hypothetical protein
VSDLPPEIPNVAIRHFFFHRGRSQAAAALQRVAKAEAAVTAREAEVEAGLAALDDARDTLGDRPSEIPIGLQRKILSLSPGKDCTRYTNSMAACPTCPCD